MISEPPVPPTPSAAGGNSLPSPSCVWTADRPELTSILWEARWRIASPWAVLAAAITRSLLTIPYDVRYRSERFPEGSPLNLAIALVGQSGTGKGTPFHAAARAVDFEGSEIPESATARSGEGIPALLAYMQTEKGMDPELRWRRPDRALWLHWDEVGHLAAQGARTGSTALEVIKSLTSGERLGGQNSKGDGLTIPGGGYRAALTVAVQPRRAGALLSDEAIAGGLAARFLWMRVEDPEAAAAARPTTATQPVSVGLGHWGGVRYVDALPTMDAAHEADTRAAHLGERDPLDSRLLLNRAVVSIALANMAGRAVLTAEDWHLAGGIIAHSLHTLEHVRDALAEPEPDETARAQRVVDRLRERLGSMRAEGVPFHEARPRLSRAQGNRLTELLHSGDVIPW